MTNEKGVRILFFGGTGEMGRRAVNEIYNFREIKQITIAGRSREKYEKLLKSLDKKENKLHFLKADLERCKDLSQLIKDYDIVANTSGPAYKYELKLAEAAIKAGVDYVSICDDYDAAKQVLRIDEAAKEHNVRILTGFGWTPGLSNIMVRAGANCLDEVKKINICWAGNSEDKTGIAVILHVLHIFSGKIPSFKNGSGKIIPAGSGKEKVRFPHPIGEINVYHTGHPEPVTIPRYFKGIDEVTLKGGINEDLLNKLTIISGKTGLSRVGFVRELIAFFFQKTLPFWRRLAGAGPQVSGIRVDIEGFSRGLSSRLTYSAVGAMEALTGIPLAIAIRELARGSIEPGVFPPEALDTFCSILPEELHNRGIEITEEKFDI